MADTSIEWTDRVWNPTTGCDRVSPGCDHCYAMTMAKRLKGMGSAKYQNDGDPRTSGPGFAATMHTHSLDEVYKWRKPQRIFVNSMSDLFHDDVDDYFIWEVFARMAACPQHTFQVLTKRHARMRSFLNGPIGHPYISGTRWPLPNVWLGVSAENQQWANIRIPALIETPAAVRFVSAEPLLGPIDLSLVPPRIGGIPALDWVICGGESGPGARPMQPSWARSLRDECADAGVAFLFKQWGNWVTDETRPSDDPTAIRNVGKHAAGRELDGRTWDQYPGGDF